MRKPSPRCSVLAPAISYRPDRRSSVGLRNCDGLLSRTQQILPLLRAFDLEYSTTCGFGYGELGILHSPQWGRPRRRPVGQCRDSWTSHHNMPWDSPLRGLPVVSIHYYRVVRCCATTRGIEAFLLENLKFALSECLCLLLEVLVQPEVNLIRCVICQDGQ